jgi:hypothetical protein
MCTGAALEAESGRRAVWRSARVRATVAIAATAAALVATGAAIGSTVTYHAGPLTATLTAGTHQPNCKQKWPLKVTAKLRGKATHATAVYQFLLGGQVVSTQYPFGMTARNPHNTVYHFYGSFTDNTFGPFGALSVGQHLTVRAVVKVSHYTAYPSYAVDVVSVSGCPER